MSTHEERAQRLRDAVVRIRDATTAPLTSGRDKDWPYDAKEAMAEIYVIAVKALLLEFGIENLPDGIEETT